MLVTARDSACQLYNSMDVLHSSSNAIFNKVCEQWVTHTYILRRLWRKVFLISDSALCDYEEGANKNNLLHFQVI
jgi:hypothetical protein